MLHAESVTRTAAENSTLAWWLSDGKRYRAGPFTRSQCATRRQRFVIFARFSPFGLLDCWRLAARDPFAGAQG